ncbi:hypothetical protein PISMIDRAFT_9460 [Pisolithus microcarpus 441]|uniref:Spt6 SH2 domain-containing protein n=1 Tax=Pisolithus microcarpus 441 TaxID=765257 RepID=A0A0D0A0T1_9AGAM|nr:hypothetical protein BKA83DRAFT_9460 [Pisolithus microcarpus]KIK25723.1 hypothetical protein PISMIDRAFT_9460 [Pisolithus microcarpus 441]
MVQILWMLCLFAPRITSWHEKWRLSFDALELDEGGLHGEHPSSRAVPLIMDDNDNERKLNELNLDEFAVNMFEANENSQMSHHEPDLRGTPEAVCRTKLIVNHVQAVAHKVEELMAYEKFNHRPEDSDLSLKNFATANPAKSAYRLAPNHQKSGDFNLCVSENKTATIRTWPVLITPESYCPFEAPAAGIPEDLALSTHLCYTGQMTDHLRQPVSSSAASVYSVSSTHSSLSRYGPSHLRSASTSIMPGSGLVTPARATTPAVHHETPLQSSHLRTTSPVPPLPSRPRKMSFSATSPKKLQRSYSDESDREIIHERWMPNPNVVYSPPNGKSINYPYALPAARSHSSGSTNTA